MRAQAANGATNQNKILKGTKTQSNNFLKRKQCIIFKIQLNNHQIKLYPELKVNKAYLILCCTIKNIIARQSTVWTVKTGEDRKEMQHSHT